MFYCRKESIEAAPKEIIKKAKEIIDENRKRCLEKLPKKKGKQRPFIKSTRPNKVKFYIDDFSIFFIDLLI